MNLAKTLTLRSSRLFTKLAYIDNIIVLAKRRVRIAFERIFVYSICHMRQCLTVAIVREASTRTDFFGREMVGQRLAPHISRSHFDFLP